MMEQADTVYGVYLPTKSESVVGGWRQSWVEDCCVETVFCSDSREEVAWEFLNVTITHQVYRRKTFNNQAKAQALAYYIGGNVQEFRAKVILEAV